MIFLIHYIISGK